MVAELAQAFAPQRGMVTNQANEAETAQLFVVVANIGDQSLPPEQRLTSTTRNPFKKDSPLLESGLLGPVTIQSVASSPAKPDA